MIKKILVGFIFILSILFVTGCSEQEKIKVKKNNKTVEKSNEVIKDMKIEINNKEYSINLEENETTKKLIELLPLELNMDELNGNEKYVYLDTNLPTNSYSPKHINAGDVMLFGNNCLVIFYKSFDTTYSYTKIGHIDNLPDLGNENINVKFK